MEAKIIPQEKDPTVGYYCLPLYSKTHRGRSGWLITRCPECGAKCWKTPLAVIAEEQGKKLFCTMCALKRGVYHEKIGESYD